MADCVNSSPPLISLGEIREKFRKIQGNSVVFRGVLYGDFGATPDFQENLRFGVVLGDLGLKRLLRK